MEVILKLKKQYLLLFIFLSIAAFFAPSADRVDYFLFADQKEVFSIPHFLDVSTNGIFFISGAIGLFILNKFHPQFNLMEKISFSFFSFGSILLSFGSAYFHLDPNPHTLVWDRIPMVICFNSLITFIVADRVETKGLFKLMIIFLLLGILTTFGVPYLYQNLKPYYLFQLGTILFTVLLTFSFKANKISNMSLIAMFVFYILAKITESYDHQIYQRLMVLSGHNIKHLLAGIGMIILNINLFYHLKKSNL